jgi:hypothetical protein
LKNAYTTKRRLENPEENRTRNAAWRAANPLQDTWKAMIARCTHSKSPNWSRYGGANPPVRVCLRWLNDEDGYENFVADMGSKPTPKHSISRYLDTGNYEPGNVEWATWLEQGAEKKGKIAMSKYREFKLTAALVAV